MIRAALLTLALAVGAATASAQVDITQQMGLTQKMGAAVPKDAVFTDDTGRTLKFGDLLQGRPLILLPIFYQCKTGCLLESESLMKALIRLREADLREAIRAKQGGDKARLYEVGKDFDIVVVGIHPKETWDLARAKKAEWVATYGHPDSEKGWRLLVGDRENILKVTDAIGFKYSYNEAKDLLNHPTVAAVITKDGRVSSYFVDASAFPPRMVIDAIQRADRNQIGTAQVTYALFGCIMIDPTTGARSIVISQVVKIASLLTILVVFASIAYMSVKYRQQPGGPA